MNSHDIKMKSVYNVFSNTITGGLLYEVLQQQQIALDHRVEEININVALHNDEDRLQWEVIVETLLSRDLQERWMQEDIVCWCVAKGVCHSSGGGS